LSIDISDFNKLPIEINILQRDVSEINICYENHAYKSTMVMCGSVLEYILGEVLLIIDQQQYVVALNRLIGNGDIELRGRANPIPIEELKLFEMLLLSREINILDRETYRLCDLLRDYRNLIHPNVERRTSMEPTPRRSQLSIDALNQAIQKVAEYFGHREIYVINITGINGVFIHNKDEVVAGVRSVATPLGLNVNLIETEDQLLNLINNPSPLSLVINSHGERVYMPPTSGIDWREYYQRIGRNVKEHGWIFVSVAGYPFFYHGATDQEVAGQEGLNTFLSIIDARANCSISGLVRVTPEGSAALRKYNLAALPHQLGVQRCTIWEDIEPVMKFFSEGDLCGASAIRMGRGFFVQIGLDDIFAGGLPADYGARVIGGLSLAFSLFLIS
jgi:hypothetical protein